MIPDHQKSRRDAPRGASRPRGETMTLDTARRADRGTTPSGTCAGERAGAADRRRRPPRRLVPRRVRQRHRRRGAARDRPRLRHHRPPPAPHALLHVAHRRGVRPEDSPFDWCIGAWRQVQETQPEWDGNVPFHLCLEASGHPELRLALEAPAELREWARTSCHAGRREGWLPTAGASPSRAPAPSCGPTSSPASPASRS